MLSVEGVSTAYGDLVAVRDVGMMVDQGEIVSVVGSNGAGKSTLLNTVSGVIKGAPKSGSIRFLGERIDRMGSHRIVEMGLIQVPEGRLVFPKMTVLENLELGSYTSHARKRRRETLAVVFEMFPQLATRKGQLAGSLSGGEQQMLAIGRGLMGLPKLLMLDEPSLGLSPVMLKNLFNALTLINRQGVSMLLVEQNVYQSLKLSQRAYVLENGRVVLQGGRDELLKSDYVRKVYLGL